MHCGNITFILTERFAYFNTFFIKKKMLMKTTLLHSCLLSFSEKTTVKFNDDLEFSLVPQVSGNSTYIFHVQDIKGDFEITRINSTGSGSDIPYDKTNKTFITGGTYSNYNFAFYILTTIDFKVVEYVSVSHQLHVPAARMKLLKVYECYKESFALTGHEHMNFICYIMKTRDNYIEIVVMNPMGIKIQDKTDDYRYEAADSADINLTLSFVFDPSTLEESHQADVSPAKQDLSSNEKSVQKKKPTWHEIMSDPKFADVILVSSDGKKIPSHRCVLAKYSEIFAKIIEKATENPDKINVDGFDAKTITAALEFCYGKNDAILGMEGKLFDFANKYSIHALKEACCSYFEDKLTSKNVCEVVQIAYSNGFDGLKQKCKKILTEKKAEIDSVELKELPKDILFDVYCSC
jgi:hypothetical protein